MGEAAGGGAAGVLAVDTPVMVRTRYLGSWTGGFVVAEVLDDGYRLRRLSDGAEVPQGFGFSAVRADPDAV